MSSQRQRQVPPRGGAVQSANADLRQSTVPTTPGSSRNEHSGHLVRYVGPVITNPGLSGTPFFNQTFNPFPSQNTGFPFQQAPQIALPTNNQFFDYSNSNQMFMNPNWGNGATLSSVMPFFQPNWMPPSMGVQSGYMPNFSMEQTFNNPAYTANMFNGPQNFPMTNMWNNPASATSMFNGPQSHPGGQGWNASTSSDHFTGLQDSVGTQYPSGTWINPSTFAGTSVQSQQIDAPQPKDAPIKTRRSQPPMIKVAAPVPTKGYLDQARGPVKRAEHPQQLLLILDLNGTLVDRGHKGSIKAVRPCVQEFIQYCITNHRVMIWSSAHYGNVQKVCKEIFSKDEKDEFLAIWGRDTLGLSEKQYGSRIQVYKRLETVWNDSRVQAGHPNAGEGGKWDQTNTILIDDSANKAASHPYNHLAISEFFKETLEVEREQNVLLVVCEFLDEIRKYEDVSTFISKAPFSLTGGNWRITDNGLFTTDLTRAQTLQPMNAQSFQPTSAQPLQPTSAQHLQPTSAQYLQSMRAQSLQPTQPGPM